MDTKYNPFCVPIGMVFTSVNNVRCHEINEIVLQACFVVAFPGR